MQEARAATSIGHPNIIDINDFGRMPDGSVYFAMEFLDGRGLESFMEQGQLPMDVAVHVVEQISSALGAAHERGIVHRDLKPDNIFLIKHREDENFVKVLDFGIAKVAGGSSRTTRAGMVFGTPHYMSPEQAAGQSVDHRADIYALGVMMYEMFTGQLPFDADTFMGVLTMHMYDPPPLPSEISPEIAARIGDLEGVVLRALSKKPELRYQSMAALCDDMRSVHRDGRKARPPEHSYVATNPTADTLPPPPGAVDQFDQAAASLLNDPAGAPEFSDATGSLEAPVVAKSAARMRWAVLAAVVLLVFGVIAFSGDDAASDTAKATPVVAAAPVRTPPDPKTRPVVAPILEAPGVVQSIAVASDPPGAEVFQDGALLGATPLSVPRPTTGTVDMELKLEGYRSSLMRLTSSSPERIMASLERAPTVKRPGVSASRGPRPLVGGVKSTAKKPAASGALRDMVDPWNE
jgi:serine/threonine-protein kinase